MVCSRKIVSLWTIFLYWNSVCGQFRIPDVRFEAFKPKGLRVSLNGVDGMRLVAFHINVNRPISNVEPGDYTLEWTKSNGTMWIYYDPDISLKIGDNLQYWMFIQHDSLGYKKDNQKFTITELQDLTLLRHCNMTNTIVPSSIQICSGDVIFEDDFRTGTISHSKWQRENFIPTTGPDYEFVTYRDSPQVCYVSRKNGVQMLFIKPHPVENIRGSMSFGNSCTRDQEEECSMESQGPFILPPIDSARLVSQFQFRYGTMEIKAQLPKGNWIYPQIYLESVSNRTQKLWIAYARGNENLIGNDESTDIGGRCLFAGPVLSTSEPQRSRYLRSKFQSVPFTHTQHVFKIVWQKDDIQIYVDGTLYGYVDNYQMKSLKFAVEDFVRIVLGVGVGGVSDFPDGFQTDGLPKPWRNRERGQMKNFFRDRDTWRSTWHGDETALKVDYVKIWAL